jgi:hypothetical protein
MTDREDFIFKAAHCAGMLEHANRIYVSGWEPLQRVVCNFIDTYNGADWWLDLEIELLNKFPLMK